MPSDLHQQLLDAIRGEQDPNFRRLLMLFLNVEEVFIGHMEELKEQMTVPAKQHAEDHAWISAARKASGGMRAAGWRLAYSVAEKGALVAAGVFATRFFGG